MEESKLGVALVKELCPICTKEYNGPIYINTRLTRINAEKVEEMHGKVVGYMEEPCEECKVLYDGKVAFIECKDGSKESEPYRTGLIVGIKDEVVVNIIKPDSLLHKVLGAHLTYISKSSLEVILGDLYPKDEN